MLKPTTVRVPDDFLDELAMFVKDMKLDRSVYLRDILRKGFEEDKQERLLAKYQDGELSAGEVCRILDISRWKLFALLRKKNVVLNVNLEDWLDSARLG